MKILTALTLAALLCGGAAAADQKADAGQDAWKNRVFTAEELKKFNGKDGNPAYVAVDGVVYDVSKSKFWGAGRHMMMYNAGTDLSSPIHGKAPKYIHRDGKILEKMPKVGVMKVSVEAKAAAAQAQAATTPAARAADQQQAMEKKPEAQPQPKEASKSLVALHKVTREELGLEATCPVSGAKVRVAADTPAVDLKGKTYYFSSSAVMEKFGKDPAKYLTEKAKGFFKKK